MAQLETKEIQTCVAALELARDLYRSDAEAVRADRQADDCVQLIEKLDV